MQTGRERDWLYIVHVNTSKDKSRDSWKAPGPTMPDLDRALQGYSYDLVEVAGETAAHSLVRWVEESSIDVLVISAGRSRRLPNPMQSRTTDYIAANSACATLVIHPKVRAVLACLRILILVTLPRLTHPRGGAHLVAFWRLEFSESCFFALLPSAGGRKEGTCAAILEPIPLWKARTQPHRHVVEVQGTCIPAGDKCVVLNILVCTLIESLQSLRGCLAVAHNVHAQRLQCAILPAWNARHSRIIHIVCSEGRFEV